VLFLLGPLLDALIVTADAVDRIGEPDRAVGGDGDVIGRVQLLAVVLVRDDGDRAVELGPCDAPDTMLMVISRPSRSIVFPFEFIDGWRKTLK